MPRVRFSISGTKSGISPEALRKHSQCKFRISRFRTVGDPQTLENKYIPSLEEFQNCAMPVRLGPFPFFGRAPSIERTELVMESSTVLGAPPFEGSAQRTATPRSLRMNLQKMKQNLSLCLVKWTCP